MMAFFRVLMALEAVSWIQAVQTIGLALNTTLAAFLAQRRVRADERAKSDYLNIVVRLEALERGFQNCQNTHFGESVRHTNKNDRR